MRGGKLPELVTLFIQILQALTKTMLSKQLDIWTLVHLRKAKLMDIKHSILPMHQAEHVGLLNIIMF